MCLLEPKEPNTLSLIIWAILKRKVFFGFVLFLLDFEGSHDDDDAQLLKCGVRKALNFRKT